MVTSRDFLARLENLRQALSNGTQNQFPFKEPTGLFMMILKFDLEGFRRNLC